MKSDSPVNGCGEFLLEPQYEVDCVARVDCHVARETSRFPVCRLYLLHHDCLRQENTGEWEGGGWKCLGNAYDNIPAFEVMPSMLLKITHNNRIFSRNYFNRQIIRFQYCLSIQKLLKRRSYLLLGSFLRPFPDTTFPATKNSTVTTSLKWTRRPRQKNQATLPAP